MPFGNEGEDGRGPMKDLTLIGQRLHAEHEQTLSMLNALEDIILGRPADEPLDLGADGAREILETLITVVDQDVNKHFLFEETELFPILRQKGAADMADLLTHEHVVIRPLAEGLKLIARTALETGFDRDGWGQFRVHVMDLMERETWHIQKEEMGLVRVLAYFIDADTDRILAQRYDELA